MPERQSAEPEPRETNERHENLDDDPLNRTFGDREQKADTGENFRFDFSQAHKDHDDAPDEHEFTRPEQDESEWQVGEPPADFARQTRRPPTMMDDPEALSRRPIPVRRMGLPLESEVPRVAKMSPAKQPAPESEADEDRAQPSMPGSTHSSGYFLGVFFFVALGFLGASALICNEPAASAHLLNQSPTLGEYFAPPILPATLVTLHDVSSKYYQLKGGHVALLIAGKAENVGSRPLHLVQIDASLLDSGARPVASQSVYCGNELSSSMLGEMTPREIEFSQALSPPKGFSIEPSSAAHFVMVFIDPPSGAGKIRIGVSKASADPGASAPPPA